MTAAPSLRALVTGGTGFLGSRLARRLVADGWETHLLVRPGSDLSPVSALRDRIGIHAHDGTQEGISRILRDARPGVVFHLASLFLATHRPQDAGPLVESNVHFPTLLLEAMASSGAARLVNTGTSWTHFGNRRYDPVNLYAATKQAFTDVLRYYHEGAGIQAVTLELFDTYGPGDPRPKLFPALRRAADSGERLAMSPGHQLLDLVYVDDVIEGYLVASRRLLAGRVKALPRYALSSGHPVTLREVVALYSRITGRRIEADWGGRPYRPREVMTPWSRGTPLPGWSPRVGLEEGIRRMEEPA